jgi:hypothetical protein
MKCRLCGKNVFECGGWLERVNETGVDGIWECRPDCNTTICEDDAVLGAIEGENVETS